MNFKNQTKNHNNKQPQPTLPPQNAPKSKLTTLPKIGSSILPPKNTPPQMCGISTEEINDFLTIMFLRH